MDGKVIELENDTNLGGRSGVSVVEHSTSLGTSGASSGRRSPAFPFPRQILRVRGGEDGFLREILDSSKYSGAILPENRKS